MTENEVEVKLAEHGKEIGSLKHRMKEAEDVVSVVHQLAQEIILNWQRSLGLEVLI